MPQCIDNTEYLNLNVRMNVPMEDHDRTTYPEAQIRTKLAKSRNWAVCKTYVDPANKCFVYKCSKGLNSDDTEIRTISFEEACKEFHWSELKLINNNQTIKFKRDMDYYNSIPAIERRAKKNAKQFAIMHEEIKVEKEKKDKLIDEHLA